VHDALLGAQPAQLGVADQTPPEAAHVGPQLVDVGADDDRRERLDGGDLHLGAAPEGEREAVALGAVAALGVQDDIGRRVVGVGVHGIRAVERPRGREADVEGLERSDVHEPMVR
jgi:hypothetical protein